MKLNKDLVIKYLQNELLTMLYRDLVEDKSESEKYAELADKYWLELTEEEQEYLENELVAVQPDEIQKYLIRQILILAK